ncbi:MAG: hypothetical protein Q8M94_02765 [Ignavibacteria bacterium]|nr:hypothetical protein [Ignavibacteria bacterium]
MNPINFAMSCMLVCLKWRASVTSWGRTEKRNDLVKGYPGSYHLNWLGIDAVLDDQKKNIAFEKDCAIFGVTALYQNNHYHLQPK